MPPKRSSTGLVVTLVALVVVLCLGIIVTVVLVLLKAAGSANAAADLSAVIDYHQTDPGALAQTHQSGTISYPMTPPAGGPHDYYWQNCTGDVYDAPIADEKAVHSLEHGAVWITYRPGLDAASVQRLADRVSGVDHMLLSPHPRQTAPISLQAWGYQLAVDRADDPRIDAFIRKYRITAGPEKGATCAGGWTATAG